MPKLIVSYRRSDSAASAGRIVDHLVTHFGSDSVYLDVENIPFGTDFRSHIRTALLSSDVLLAVIGPRWTGLDAAGQSRLGDESDPVRVEIETALRSGITIVPLLIDGAAMPTAGQLPDALKDLAFLNAAPIDMGRDFHPHMDRLTRALETMALATPPRPFSVAPAAMPPAAARPPGQRPVRMMGAVAGLVVAVGIGLLGWRGIEAARHPELAKPVPLDDGSRSSIEARRAGPQDGGARPETARSANTLPAPPVQAGASPLSGALAQLAPPAAPPPAAAPTAQVAPVQAAPASPAPPSPLVPSSAPAPSGAPSAQSRFAWYELWTTDAPAALRFYRQVVGWEARSWGEGEAAYTMLSAGPVPVGGIATLSSALVGQGVRPAWLGYVSVADVDRSVAELRALGGVVYRAPSDLPNVGRLALVADPQGAVFVLFKGLAEMPPPPVPPSAGYSGWRELRASDRDAALTFYAALLGWTGEAPEADGARLFAAGADVLGDVRQKDGAAPAPSWLYAFQVDGIAAATARVEAGGGKVSGPPRRLPNGAWGVSCLDPTGAAFALVSANL